MNAMTPENPDPVQKRKAIISARNRALGLILAALAVLFFAITIVKLA